MLSLKPVKDDNKSLREFLRAIEGHTEGIQSTRGFIAEQLVCGILSPLLTGVSRQQWKTYITSTIQPPTLNQLTTFLVKRRDAARDDHPVEEISSSAFSRLTPAKSKPPGKDKKPFGKAFQACEAPILTCSVCQQNHYTFKCPTINGQTVNQRWETVKQKRLCYNCLSVEHAVGGCHSCKSCRECGRKHHTLLHRPSTSTQVAPPAPVSAPAHVTITNDTHDLAAPASPLLVTDVAPVLQAASNPLNGILLQTAVVDVSAGHNAFNTRMVLDSGAVMSLVTSKLVNSI